MKIVGEIIKGAALALLAAAGLLAAAAGLAYAAFYDSREDFKSDVGAYIQAARVDIFNRGYVKVLASDDVRYVYENRCYKKCHGEAAMITAVLSPSGWFQVVERMRAKENTEITGREADVIIKYLEEKYPTAPSAYSYEVRKKIHEAVWRNDMGQGDIYCDVIFTTPEYLKSIGAEQLRDQYKLNEYDVFIVSFTVHEGELDTADLDSIAHLATPAGRIASVPPWSLRFQTSDKHHYEAVVRFKKISGGDKPPTWMELGLDKVGGPKERLYKWTLPIKYPDGVTVEGKGSK
jgi:hypothetical protein